MAASEFESRSVEKGYDVISWGNDIFASAMGEMEASESRSMAWADQESNRMREADVIEAISKRQMAIELSELRSRMDRREVEHKESLNMQREDFLQRLFESEIVALESFCQGMSSFETPLPAHTTNGNVCAHCKVVISAWPHDFDDEFYERFQMRKNK